MISEAAICLVKDQSDTPGGIWSSASALGNPLIDRLKRNAGLTFEIE